MPIFDYKCECGNEVEKMVKSSATLVECSLCGAKMTRTISGGQSFYFKGAGVYSEKSMAPRKPKS